MAVTDPLDARLLAALAEVGKIAVHELAAKVGMDPREVAYRLVALSGSGLPLLVGVESDPHGLRAALAGVRPQYPVPVRAPQPPPPPPVDPVLSTWGPPQTASWARGDRKAAPQRAGRIGDALATQGLDGEQLTVQLLEVQDPADFLFGAAGYRLEPGERAVVVHTEISNRGGVPFGSLPDNYLELVTADGKAIGKAPVSLTSRPPHRIGVRPGETTGGHTVYLVPEATRVVSVRWSPRPEPDERTLTPSLAG